MLKIPAVDHRIPRRQGDGQRPIEAGSWKEHWTVGPVGPPVCLKMFKPLILMLLPL